MRIEKLVLEDFRCFNALEVNFHPELTVLVADNGGGKSSILRALGVALSEYISAFPLQSITLLGLVSSDLRQRVSERALQTRIALYGYEVGVVENLIDDGAFSTFVKYPDESGIEKNISPGVSAIEVPYYGNLRSVAQAYYEKVFNGKYFTLPLLANYGADRVWMQAENKANDLRHSELFDERLLLSRVASYLDALDAGSNYTSFFHWFEYISKIDADEKRALFESDPLTAMNTPTEYGVLIEGIREPVNKCLKETGWSNISYSHKHQKITMSHSEQGVMELNQLSDGIRNTIAMVADIALRCVRLNKHLGRKACAETPGVVMIDEVDLHLHPSWQQRIIPSLMAAFPKVQFIVTTHSPQVLSTVRKESIRVLGSNVDGEAVAAEPLAASYAQPSNDVLQSIMGVDPQPPVQEKVQLQRLTALVDQGLYASEEAENLLQVLEGCLIKGHPQLAKIYRSIRRQKALQGH